MFVSSQFLTHRQCNLYFWFLETILSVGHDFEEGTMFQRATVTIIRCKDYYLAKNSLVVQTALLYL